MALAPTHPEWTLAAAPASARAKDIGKSGMRLKLPLTTTGSTAPEANLETAFGPTSGAETHLELSSTAEAAPPT